MSYFRIHITKLPPRCTKEHLMNYFSQFGVIFSVKVTLDKHKRSKGHGKLTVPDKQTFDRILSKEHWIFEKKINLEPFLVGSNLNKKEQMVSQRKIAIFNVKSSMSKPYLHGVFSKYGEVEDCIIKSKNQDMYAFITFKDEKSAMFLKKMGTLKV